MAPQTLPDCAFGPLRTPLFGRLPARGRRVVARIGARVGLQMVLAHSPTVGHHLRGRFGETSMSNPSRHPALKR